MRAEAGTMRKRQRGRTCRHNLKDVPAGDTANEVGSGRRMAVLNGKTGQRSWVKRREPCDQLCRDNEGPSRSGTVQGPDLWDRTVSGASPIMPSKQSKWQLNAGGKGPQPSPSLPWECAQSSTRSRTDTWVFFSHSVLGRRAQALLSRPPLALHFSPTGSLALLLFFGSFIKGPLSPGLGKL